MERIRKHSSLLSKLLKRLVAERFKRMAKEESLFKFLTIEVDPAVLVDQAWMAEREAVELTEMSLLSLVTRDSVEGEIRKSSLKIQKALETIFSAGSKKSSARSQGSFLADDLVEERFLWLAARMDFYRKWLSLSVEAESPLELGRRGFGQKKNFEKAVTILKESDRRLAEGLVRETPALHRFLMTKYLEAEVRAAHDLWQDFAAQAFRKNPELTD